jgi:O-methyltransferase
MNSKDPHTSGQFNDALNKNLANFPGFLKNWCNRICPPMPRLSLAERCNLLGRIARISRNVECPHDETEVLSFIYGLLALPESVEGKIVECGTFKGGSAAKFSIPLKTLGRDLVIFDSFEGLPENEEPHENSFLGHRIAQWCKGGEFRGALDEVKHSITTYGEPSVVDYIKGYFDDSMPGYEEKIAAVYMDVDLVTSTKSVLKHLFPLLSPGGFIMSQDGDFPLVIEAFESDKFWEDEVGCPKPRIDGLGERKMVTIFKPTD